MADTNNQSPVCECHMMEVIAETPMYPVAFDVERGAYFLCGECPISHCISCGGSLPKPKYPDAVEPDPNDEREALAIVESINSLDELVDALGKPDETVYAEDFDPTGYTAALYRMQERYPDIYCNNPNYRWTRYVRYGHRWATLYLDVYEYPDGRLEPSVTGLGPNEFVIVERRRWWSRYFPQLTRTT